MSGRRRNSGTLPGSRRLTFESRTFPKFWPDTESFESRGERSRKDSVYRDYTNFAGAGEPGRFICLAQCLRTSGGRSQRSGKWKISMPLHRCRVLLCCRIELLAPPLECPVVDASLSGEKGNKLLWTVELWSMLLHAFSHQWRRIGEGYNLYPTRNLVPDHVVKHLVLFRKFSS